MDFTRDDLPSWFGRAAIVGILALSVVGAVFFLGGSVSQVLSTVGSSIPAGAFAGGQGSTGSSTDAGSGSSSGGNSAGGGSGGKSGGGGITRSGDEQLYDPTSANLQIIKTGTLDLEVAAIDDALGVASTKIDALGGYASGSQRSGDGASARASVTYRIPAARWDDALVGLRALGTKVIAEQAKTDDVTGQIVDLGARITNLQVTEQALQAIMAKATKIPDILEVQTQLTDVRGQIEQLSGERKQLQDQAAMSTLTVTYSLKAPEAVVTTASAFDPGTEVDHASARFIRILQHVAAAGIWFGIVWLPILLVLGIVVVVLFFIARRVRRSSLFGGGRGGLVPAGPPDV